jgi:hypothetical protein
LLPLALTEFAPSFQQKIQSETLPNFIKWMTLSMYISIYFYIFEAILMRILLALIALSSALPAFAETAVPNTPTQWLDRMTDFTQNTLPARDPKALIGLVDAFTEPSFQQQRLNRITEPALWSKIWNTATSPGALANMESLATPQTATNWSAAMMDLRFYQAMMATLTDPGKEMRWSMATMDPASYQPFEKMAGPEVYSRWEQVAAQPEATWLVPFTGSHVDQAGSVAQGAGPFFPFSITSH